MVSRTSRLTTAIACIGAFTFAATLAMAAAAESPQQTSLSGLRRDVEMRLAR